MGQRSRLPLTLAIWAILAGAGALLSIFYIGFGHSVRLEREVYQQLTLQDSLLHHTYRTTWDAQYLLSEATAAGRSPDAGQRMLVRRKLREIDSAGLALDATIVPESPLHRSWMRYREVLDSILADIEALFVRSDRDRSPVQATAPVPSAPLMVRLRIARDEVHRLILAERLEEIASIDRGLEEQYVGWAIVGFGFVVGGIVLGLYVRRKELGHLESVKRLAAGEEQFRTLVEQAQDAILIVQEQTMTYANPAALKLFEFASLEEMARSDLFALVGPRVRSILIERSAGRTIGEEVSRGEEVRSMTQQGRLVDLEVSASMIAWGHRPAVQATFRDITGRKMQEREQALLMWEQEALSQIDRRLIGVVDLGRILDLILGHLINLTRAQWAGVLLREGGSQKFRWRSMAGAAGPKPAEAFALAPQLRAILGSAEPFVLQEVTTPTQDRLTHAAGVSDENILSSVWIPLKGDPEARGVLAVGYRQTHEFSSRELRLLVSLAEKMSIAAANASLYEDLLARERELEILSGLRVNAQEEERRRIAREIHDGLGQILTAVKFNVEILEDSPSLNDDEHRRIADVKTLLDNVMKEAREISYNLMPSVLDDFGLAPALQLLAERFGVQTGVRVTFVAHGMAERLPATVEIALYRIVQEALTNAVRHGHAKLVAIQVFRSGDEVRLTVEDDGCGMDPDRAMERQIVGSGIGLASMRERVNSFRGLLDIESSLGNGTLITVRIPILPLSKAS
jgi:PAS domain S-box-containing protein